MQALVFVEIGAADEPATTEFALKGSVAAVGATMNGQQGGPCERTTTHVAGEGLGHGLDGVERSEVSTHAALEGERLAAGGARHTTVSALGDGLCQEVCGVSTGDLKDWRAAALLVCLEGGLTLERATTTTTLTYTSTTTIVQLYLAVKRLPAVYAALSQHVRARL